MFGVAGRCAIRGMRGWKCSLHAGWRVETWVVRDISFLTYEVDSQLLGWSVSSASTTRAVDFTAPCIRSLDCKTQLVTYVDEEISALLESNLT